MFEDLPCPPPEIQSQLEPGERYSPVLVPPDDVLAKGLLNGSQYFAGCTMPFIRDPSGFAVRAEAITGPDDGGID